MSTGTTALKEVATGVTEKPKDFPSMLTAWLPEIKRALPKHLNGDRMARIALTAFRRTPKLAKCDPRSVFAAVIQAAQLGLEPDTLGRSYLIPYEKKKKGPGGWTVTVECQFVPGWKGLVDLMNRSGQGTVYTGVIFRDQDYVFRDGSKRELDITNETSLGDPSDITHAFAVGHIKGGMFPVIELWRMAKVIKHRDRYNKVGESHYSFGNLEMYARKVVLLQVLKYMPCSPELAAAMALNDDAEIGKQHIDLKDAIEGTWEPAPDEGDDVPDPSVGRAQGEVNDSAAQPMHQQGTGATPSRPKSESTATETAPAGAAESSDWDAKAHARADLSLAVAEAIEGLTKHNNIASIDLYSDSLDTAVVNDDRYAKAVVDRLASIKGRKYKEQ
jgi:recombination protein RecT